VRVALALSASLALSLAVGHFAPLSKVVRTFLDRGIAFKVEHGANVPESAKRKPLKFSYVHPVVGCVDAAARH